MISLAICDDDEAILEYLEEKLTCHYGERIRITAYRDAEQLVSEWDRLGEHKEDVVIMDIRYSKSNGIDAVLEIQESYGHTLKVIFLTGYSDYSTEIFRAEPTYFLMKPIDDEKLFAAVDRAIEKVEEDRERTISFHVKGKLYNLDVNKIVYIESDRRIVIIHERNQEIRIAGKLDDIETQLPGSFLRCHKSFLVNMNFISSFDGTAIRTANDVVIPVSRRQAKTARNEFYKYLGKTV